ncbi:PucR family transcriptional regulator [Neobacillus sp. Marseille-QA0830]
MLRDLLTLYKDSYLLKETSDIACDNVYVFCDVQNNESICIPKQEIGEKELRLLKTLYQQLESSPVFPSATDNWHKFLWLNGPAPVLPLQTSYRFIQFQVFNDHVAHKELESALKGFFTEEVMIIWDSLTRGLIIKEKRQISLSEEELISMLETLESDFFVKISFFIGKIYPFSDQLPSLFKQEREFFTFALTNISHSGIFNYERIFPVYLAYHMPVEIIQAMNPDVYELFSQDPEMYSTILVFLENNLNASLTAKKLYIHRNTLQYRIDKFTEKTGIGLKDFYGAFTVFLACLLFEHKRN